MVSEMKIYWIGLIVCTLQKKRSENLKHRKLKKKPETMNRSRAPEGQYEMV